MTTDENSSPPSSPKTLTFSSSSSVSKSALSETESMAMQNNNGAPIETGSGGMAIRKFNGKNYIQWSQSIRMFITGKTKREHLTEVEAKLEESDATAFTKWDNEDNQVRFWLISTMEPDIGDNYLLHQSAKELWDDVKETYSTQDNSSALYEVESKLYNFKQGELSITEYYNKLARTWLQLDTYEAQTRDTPKDAKTIPHISGEEMDSANALRTSSGVGCCEKQNHGNKAVSRSTRGVC